jgi:hypothetical protein
MHKFPNPVTQRERGENWWFDTTNLRKKVARLQKNLADKNASINKMKKELQTFSLDEAVEQFPPVPQALFKILPHIFVYVIAQPC